VQQPVEKGADEESEDAKGRTPLSWAAARGREAVVQLLLGNDANVESGDGEPLSRAAGEGTRRWCSCCSRTAPTWSRGMHTTRRRCTGGRERI
jgi:hypothetical protein